MLLMVLFWVFVAGIVTFSVLVFCTTIIHVTQPSVLLATTEELLDIRDVEDNLRKVMNYGKVVHRFDRKQISEVLEQLQGQGLVEAIRVDRGQVLYRKLPSRHTDLGSAA